MVPVSSIVLTTLSSTNKFTRFVEGVLGVATCSVKLMILIAACPRSGTLYIAEVLGKMGFDVGHERLHKDGIVDYRLAMGFERLEGSEDVLFHQVRHPLNTISSLVPLLAKGDIWKKCKECIPEDNVVERAVKFWYYWNRMIEAQRPDFTYKVEDFLEREVFDKFCKFIGAFTSLKMVKEVKKVPTDRNSTYNRQVPKGYAKRYTWKDMEEKCGKWANKARSLGLKYGYG